MQRMNFFTIFLFSEIPITEQRDGEVRKCATSTNNRDEQKKKLVIIIIIYLLHVFVEVVAVVVSFVQENGCEPIYVMYGDYFLIIIHFSNYTLCIAYRIIYSNCLHVFLLLYTHLPYISVHTYNFFYEIRFCFPFYTMCSLRFKFSEIVMVAHISLETWFDFHPKRGRKIYNSAAAAPQQHAIK